MRSRTTTRSTTSSERRQKVALLAGTALNRIGQGFFGVMGPLLVTSGLAMYSLPLGVISLGLIFWALDRRVP